MGNVGKCVGVWGGDGRCGEVWEEVWGTVFPLGF